MPKHLWIQLSGSVGFNKTLNPSGISRGDPIYIDSDGLVTTKLNGPVIGIALADTEVRLSYLEWYAHKLMKQTMGSGFEILDMVKYIERLYPKHDYETVIKNCLLLRRLTRTFQFSNQWDSIKLIMDHDLNIYLGKALKNFNRACNKHRIRKFFKRKKS